jgi:hypothetical protein
VQARGPERERRAARRAAACLSAGLHVARPEKGNAVVSDPAVAEAIAEGQLDVAQAIGMGVMRLYGVPQDVAVAYDWLTAATRA